ncbi:MAG TPA: hypothetical protein PK014_14540 [Thermoanaerobaculia bacterium]|nr:hypothetical protein [Thermoanaerobaculia bacterium]HUM31261.1 hypothetical protein [Thermoanaerobaculia bacterium]HXK69612.1 hypothetical protein [Thermoanaerobaculia bacterium]
MPNSHILYMVIFSLLTSAFFAIFWREERREMVKLFLKILAYMVLGGIAVAWLMYLLPPR